MAVVVLVGVYAGQVLHAIRGQSLTWDEGDHIFAGYESWQTHDFGLNPEHPPMVKLVATLPLLGLPLKVPALQGRFFKTEAYLDGRELLFRNGPANGGQYTAEQLTLRVRMAAMVFGVATALVVFAFAAEMFSVEAGLLALLLFCFEPNILAHGGYVTTDMAASGTMLATVYAFWRWTERQTTARLAVVGLAGGLALAAKHSTVLLLPMLVLLGAWAVVLQVRDANDGRREWLRATGKMAAALAAIVVLACAVLWAFYGFRYDARPGALRLSPTLAAYVRPLAPGEAAGILAVARWHLLPESWLYGLADVRAMANSMPSYFFGRVYEHGLWYYFPVLLLIKSTLGELLLWALAVVAMAQGWLGSGRRLVFVLLPPGLYLLVAMDSQLNIGARHVLPVWVFGCVLAGAAAAALLRRGRWWAAEAAVGVLLQVASSVRAAPLYIPYANEAWGGPSQTYRYLSDSNTDWAQQLLAVRGYLTERHVTQCWFAYFAEPFLQPADYGIPCRPLPTADSLSVDARFAVPPVVEGPVLVSAGDLNGFELGSSVLNPYESLRGVRPVAFVQDGVFVYDGRFALPLASALEVVQESTAALAAQDLPLAVSTARRAEQVAPGAVQTEMALGDALLAAGDRAGAEAAFGRAGRRIATMEPDARAVWEKTLREHRAGKRTAG